MPDPLPPASNAEPLLSVRDLAAGFDTERGTVRAVDGISFDVPRGRTLGVVGESGCGKSVTAFSIMRLLPQPHGRILGGEILFRDEDRTLDLARATEPELHATRARRIGMVFQEPLSALNPVHAIGRQISEVYLRHRSRDRREALQLSVDMLRQVGIPSPEIRVTEYPHQLSGGMRQRVVIAMALACSPALLIADEPTTALDVTIQAQILALIQSLQRRLGMSVLLITHDLGVIATVCDVVAVMYAGRIVETGPVADLFRAPAHPYTRGLLSSIPRLELPHKSRLRTIEGMVPALHELPSGCRFRNRCPHAIDACATTVPPLEDVAPGHRTACLRWRDLPAHEPVVSEAALA